MFRVYKVSRTEDEWGRRGGVVGYYQTLPDAKTAAEGKGWYGGAGAIDPVWVVFSATEFEYYELASTTSFMLDVDFEEQHDKKVNAALAKLTVLGLSC